MKKLKRGIKYKAVSASQTINNIRNILFENDITVKETHHESDINELESCTLAFYNKGLEHLELCTNGKGMNFEYSLASAYAEFMERLQNDLLFKSAIRYPNRINKESYNDAIELKETIRKEGLIKEFFNSPDEVFLSKNELIERFGKHFKRMFNTKSNESLLKLINDTKTFDLQKKVLCLPYYNVSKKTVELVPTDTVRILCGSNGMCAGNTKKEAFVQGLCEVFERFAMRNIYMDEVDLPEIPKDYFIGEKIYDIITEMEKKNNYTISVKDASCGIGLPVIGLLIVDNANHRYTFHLGADPSPITALERCLTEINQGIKHALKYKMTDIHETWNHFDQNGVEFSNNDRTRFELFKTLKEGKGIWPNYIFKNTGSFNGFNKVVSQTDEENITYLLDIVNKQNTEVLVRDVSTYGFTSLYIYVPGMSEVDPHFLELLRIQAKLVDNSQVLFRLKDATSIEINSLANTLKEKYLHNPFNKPDLSKHYFGFINDISLKTLSFELFVAMLFIRVKDYKNAHYFIEKHIEEERKCLNKKDLYLLCASDFVRYKSQKNSDEEILTKLNMLHHKELVKEVIEDLSEPEKIFQYHNIPTCFNCDSCDLVNNCDYLKIIRTLSKHQAKKASAKINQADLVILNN